LNFNKYTTYVNTTGDDLAAGDPVAVSGFTDSNDEILVTYVERLATAPATTILEGIARNVDAGAGTFRIGGQIVNYGSAIIAGIPGGILQDGSLVRVEGMPPAGNMLVATRVTPGQSLQAQPDDIVHVEELITSVAAPDRFTVGAVTVATHAGTLYTNGSSSGITVDKRVQVSGSLDSNGVLQADTIRFVVTAELEMEAKIDAVDAAAGTIEILGRTIHVDNFTIMIDSSTAGLQNFSVGDLVVNDRLVVNVITGGPAPYAGRVERIDPPADNSISSIQGAVTAAATDPLLEIAGTTYDTAVLTNPGDFSQGPFQITRNGFFTAVTPGMVVRFTGTFAGGVYTLTHAAIVNCCTWLVYTDVDGNLVGGGKDADFNWDGTLDTDSHSTNVNATLSSTTPILGYTWIASDMRIFGPGTYQFDTGLVEDQSTNFGTTNLGGIVQTLTVGPNQLGAHVLFHWGQAAATICGRQTCNTDVIFLWDINGTFQGSSGAGDDLGAKQQVFNLSSVDGDNDGVPGISIVAGPFTGISNAYNLNHAPP